MEIKLNGKGKDEGRTIVLRDEGATETEAGKYLITIGEETIQVDGDELRRAAVALCPEEELAMM